MKRIPAGISEFFETQDIHFRRGAWRGRISGGCLTPDEQAINREGGRAFGRNWVEALQTLANPALTVATDGTAEEARTLLRECGYPTDDNS